MWTRCIIAYLSTSRLVPSPLESNSIQLLADWFFFFKFTFALAVIMAAPAPGSAGTTYPSRPISIYHIPTPPTTSRPQPKKKKNQLYFSLFLIPSSLSLYSNQFCWFGGWDRERERENFGFLYWKDWHEWFQSFCCCCCWLKMSSVVWSYNNFSVFCFFLSLGCVSDGGFQRGWGKGRHLKGGGCFRVWAGLPFLSTAINCLYIISFLFYFGILLVQVKLFISFITFFFIIIIYRFHYII